MMNRVLRVSRRGVARTGVCGLAALGGLGLMAWTSAASGGVTPVPGPIEAEPVCLEDAPNGYACDSLGNASDEGCPTHLILQNDECLTVTQAASGLSTAQSYSATCKVKFWYKDAEGNCVSETATRNRRCKSATGAGCSGQVGQH